MLTDGPARARAPPIFWHCGTSLASAPAARSSALRGSWQELPASPAGRGAERSSLFWGRTGPAVLKSRMGRNVLPALARGKLEPRSRRMANHSVVFLAIYRVWQYVHRA